jgi:hypothetical protein
MSLLSQQIPMFPQPRACIIDGEIYVSVLDAYRIYGKSKSPNKDWERDKRELAKQGYDMSNLTGHQFVDVTGKLNKPTPIVSKAQLARIIQVTRSPEWESHRQEMADLFAEKHSSKPAKPFEATKRYRELRNSGLSHEEALDRRDTDLIGVEAHKRAVKEWYERNGDIAALTNHATRLITGKSATALKRLLNIKVSPRAYISTLERGALAIVEDFGAILHRRRDSRGTDELARDLNDASQVIDHDKLNAMLSDAPIMPPLPKPQQRRLLKGE